MKHIISAVFFLLVLSLSAPATDHGIFVDGGFRKGSTKLNGLVTDRVDRAKATFDKRAGSSSQKASSKASLCTALDNITCGPGDSITLFMVGHGTRNNFVFSLATSSGDKKISAVALRNKITARITDCTCVVRIVIFSCHSGSFLDDLFKDTHVKAVYASTSAGQKSYSDAVFSNTGGFEDNGDWIDEFLKKWDSLPDSDPLGDSLAEANRCANDHMPSKFAKRQRPTGWRKGTISSRAHVESSKLSGSSKSVTVTFYDPPHLRGKKQSVKVGSSGTPTQTFTRCSWISFDAEFGLPKGDKACPKSPPTMTTPPSAATAPVECYIAHVNNKPRKGSPYLYVTLIEPNWLACRNRVLKVQPGGSIANNVKRCSFVSGKGTLTSPTGRIEVTGAVSQFNYCPEVTGRVTKITKSKNKVCVRILQPDSLRRIYRGEICIELPSGERGLLDTLKKGHIIRFKIKTNAIGRALYRGSNVRRMASSEKALRSFDVGVGGVSDATVEVPDTEPYCPLMEIGNYGEQEYLVGASLHVEICDEFSTPVYNQTLPIPFLEGQQAIALKFPEWPTPTPGTYHLVATVDLTGGAIDENLDNNTIEFPFLVVPGTPEDSWAGEFIDLPLPMGFGFDERVVLAPGVGTGIGVTSDQLGFVHQPLDGDFFVCGLIDVPQLQPGACLGFMARTDNFPQAAMVSWLVDGGGQLSFDTRANDGGNASNQHTSPAAGPGVWMGLERLGDLFTVYTSNNGDDWNLLAQQTLVGLPSELLVGIGSYSGQNQTQPPSEVPFFALKGFPVGLSEIVLFEELSAFAVSDTEIQLAWPDLVATEFGYDIFCSSDGTNFSLIDTTGPDVTTYNDTGLAPGVTYLYQVHPVVAEGLRETPVIATAETHGAGLEAWALANGIGDPFLVPSFGGQEWVFHYYTGFAPVLPIDGMDILQPQVVGGVPILIVEKAPGLHDQDLVIQSYDAENAEWEDRFEIDAISPSGTYEFEAPTSDSGISLQRAMVKPAD